MKLSLSLLMILVMSNAKAEPTPPGTAPTYTTSEGKSFTYYYKDGTPVPPEVRIFVSGIGTSQLMNANEFLQDALEVLMVQVEDH